MVSRLLNILIRLTSLASLGLAVVLVVSLYLIQLPSIQTRLAREATDWLSVKIGGPIQIDRVKVRWFDDISLEGVRILDLKKRPMIEVAEVFVNFQTNFQFDRVNLVRFDNNLDYVLLREPNVKLIREADGDFNFDKWIAQIQHLAYPNPDTTAPENNIPFTIDEAIIQDGKLSLTDPRKARFPKEEFDYRNFTLNEISGQINQFFIQGDTITFQGERIKAVDYRSDLRVKSLETDFFYSRQHLRLKKLEAHINDSHIRDQIELTYREPVDFDDFNHLVWMDARLDGCDIQAQDLARFAPGLYAYRDRYLLSGYFSGTVDQFVVNDFALSFGQQSFVRGQLQWQGLPDYLTANMKFDLSPSRWFESDLAQYAGPNTYKEYVQQVGQIDFLGQFEGTYTNFVTQFDINSSGLGKAKGNLDFALSESPEKSTYSGQVDIQKLALGKLVHQEDVLGKISFSGGIQGQGLTLPSAKLQLDGTVHQIEFNGYNYRHMDVNGQLGQSIFNGNVRIQDPNLVADVHGAVDFNPASNVFDIKGYLDYAHLSELGLTEAPIRLKTILDLQMSGNDINDWMGNISLRETVLKEKDALFRFDTLDLRSSQIASLRKMSLQSEYFNIQLAGEYRPVTFFQSLETIFMDFLGLWTPVLPETPQTPFSLVQYQKPSQADFSIKFKSAKPFLDYFLPGVYVSPGTHLTGNLAMGSSYKVQLIATADTLLLGNSLFKTNSAQVSIQKTIGYPDMTSRLEAHSHRQNMGWIQTDQLDLFARWNGSEPIQMEGYVQQSKSPNKLQMVGLASIKPDHYEFTLNSEETFLDLLNQRWRLPKNNRLIMNPGRIQFEQIALNGVGQKISLEGEMNEQLGKIARFSIENFDLRALQPLIRENISGIANGQISLLNAFGSPQILSNLQVEDVTHEGFLVGNIIANSRYDTQINKVLLNLELDKQKEKILTISGTYDSNDPLDPLDLTASVKKAELGVFQPFVRDIFSQLQGQMNGFVTIRGKLQQPILSGRVTIQQGHLKLDALQTDFYFSDEVVMNPKGFFTKETGFQVFDAAQKGNMGLINGGVEYDSRGKFRLNLHGTIQDREGFRLMKTTAKDNADFYGLALATGDIHLTGPLEDVLITGNLTSKRGTKLVIPLDGETTVNVEEEAIPFLDKQGRLVSKDKPVSTTDSTAENQEPVTSQLIDLNGLKMSLNLTLTPDAECEIIFDRANNDRVVAFGEGRLTVDYDTRGGFSLTGPYVVKNGKYDFSFQNLASLRKFEITEGSKITWSGDPYEAVIDMDAVYSANVSLAEIPGIPSNTSETMNRYPVKVKVHLSDQLMVPTVRFSIDFDERQIPVNFQSQTLAFEQRLRDDEQLLSRNVSSIMAFNQIFPSNIVDALRQQFLIDNLNNMLSNQIGNLANKLDPNLELGLQLGDVRQNFNNAQVNVSYKLMNDRVRLSGRSAYMNGAVGGINPQGLLTVGGEIDYMLTTDGTWRMKAYSRSMPNANFFLTGNAGGNVLVYGVSLQFSQNFNRLLPKRTFPMGTATDNESRP